MMRLRHNRVRFLFVIVLVTALVLPPAKALITRELRIEKFDAEVIVSPNGSVDVTENIQVHFIGGPWHGFYREIPIEYVTPQGLNYTLFLDVKRISDGNGRKLKFESSRVRHYCTSPMPITPRRPYPSNTRSRTPSAFLKTTMSSTGT